MTVFVFLVNYNLRVEEQYQVTFSYARSYTLSCVAFTYYAIMKRTIQHILST